MPFGTKGAEGSAMHRTVATCALFTAGIIFGLASSEWLHAQPRPAYTTKQVIQTALENLPGQEVLIFSSDWHPGFRLPLHKHPDGHEFTFVVEGEQTFEVEGLGTKVVKAGEVIYTPPNVAHFGRNATDRMSKTVVFRIKPKDQPITVNVQQ
jgi:quercetin dioxygenase-like cupin family protein